MFWDQLDMILDIQYIHSQVFRCGISSYRCGRCQVFGWTTFHGFIHKISAQPGPIMRWLFGLEGSLSCNSWEEKFVAIFVRLAYHELHADSRPASFSSFFVGRFLLGPDLFFLFLRFFLPRFLFSFIAMVFFGLNENTRKPPFSNPKSATRQPVSVAPGNKHVSGPRLTSKSLIHG